MKSFKLRPALSILLLTTAVQFSTAQNAPDPKMAAPDKAITGTMEIQFNTRTQGGRDEGGSIQKGVTDNYTVDLTINVNRKITGTITRQPKIKQMGIRTVQQSRYDFGLKWVALLTDKTTGKMNPKTVGDWVGMMPTDAKTGAYALAGGSDQDRPLRVSVDVGQVVDSKFGGVMYGKAENKTGLSWSSIKRSINGKVIETKYQADPMRFENMVLAEGPDRGFYPPCTVNGSLDYDRATGNYFAKNLTFKYAFNGKEMLDSVTGSIKWVEASGTTKGHYESNLRFNETPVDDTKAFTAAPSDSDDMFAVDTTTPGIYGNITFDDDTNGSVTKSPDGEPEPAHSKVTYDLKANKLTKQQVMNFAKLWIVCVGPTSDE